MEKGSYIVENSGSAVLSPVVTAMMPDLASFFIYPSRSLLLPSGLDLELQTPDSIRRVLILLNTTKSGVFTPI